MLKRAVLLLALGAAITLGVRAIPPAPTRPRFDGAGASAPRSGGTFVLYLRDNIRTFDPAIAYDELSLVGIRLVFDGLLDYDQEGHLVPSLAAAMPEVSEDGKRFTFHLRRGVRFHDGAELTSDDVRYTMERLLSPDVGSPGAPFFASIVGAAAFNEGRARSIAGLRVVDRYTVEFTLTDADQTFLNAMAMTFAYPVRRSSIERWGNRFGTHPLGTGPFTFESWERGVEARFVRNRHYHSPAARVDRVVVLENIDGALAVARFQAGDLDLLYTMTSAHRRFFKGSRAWAPYQIEQPDVVVAGLTMNCELPPFDDVHVRRAVAFALDRPSWSRLSNGRTQPTGQPLPPQLAGFDPNLPSLQRFDLATARRELALAGHPNGLPQPIQVIVGEGDAGRQTVEMLQADLGRIGIRVEGRGMSFAQYLEETGKPRRAQAFMSAWSMDFPDPSNFLDILFHSRSIHESASENRSFYRNPELDRLLDRARAETDPATRVALYHQANEIVARDAPWAFTTNPKSLEIWQPYVRGYRPHPIWQRNVRDLWLDLPRRPFSAQALVRPLAMLTRRSP